MQAFHTLIKSLDQLVSVYRHLHDVIQRENEALVTVELSKMVEINSAKEKLVGRVRQLDSSWQAAADLLAKKLKINRPQPTLLEIADGVDAKKKQELVDRHKVLTQIIADISELNKENGELVRSALSHITGAMDSITSTLNENPTYKQSGNMESVNKDAQGRLVSREA